MCIQEARKKQDQMEENFNEFGLGCIGNEKPQVYVINLNSSIYSFKMTFKMVVYKQYFPSPLFSLYCWKYSLCFLRDMFLCHFFCWCHTIQFQQWKLRSENRKLQLHVENHSCKVLKISVAHKYAYQGTQERKVRE